MLFLSQFVPVINQYKRLPLTSITCANMISKPVPDHFHKRRKEKHLANRKFTRK